MLIATIYLYHMISNSLSQTEFLEISKKISNFLSSPGRTDIQEIDVFINELSALLQGKEATYDTSWNELSNIKVFLNQNKQQANLTETQTLNFYKLVEHFKNNLLLDHYKFRFDLDSLLNISMTDRGNVENIFEDIRSLLITKPEASSQSLEILREIENFFGKYQGKPIPLDDLHRFRSLINRLRHTLKEEAPTKDILLFRLIGGFVSTHQGEIEAKRKLLRHTLLINTIKDYLNEFVSNLSRGNLSLSLDEMSGLTKHLDILRAIIKRIEEREIRDFSNKDLNEINKELYELEQFSIKQFNNTKQMDPQNEQRLKPLQRAIANLNQCGLFIEEICRNRARLEKWVELENPPEKIIFAAKLAFNGLFFLVLLAAIIIGTLILFPPAGFTVGTIIALSIAAKILTLAVVALGVSDFIASIANRLYEKFHYHRPFSIVNVLKSIPKALSKAAGLGFGLVFIFLFQPIKIAFNFLKFISTTNIIKNMMTSVDLTAASQSTLTKTKNVLLKAKNYFRKTTNAIIDKLGITISKDQSKKMQEEQVEKEPVTEEPKNEVQKASEAQEQEQNKEQEAGTRTPSPTPSGRNEKI